MILRLKDLSYLGNQVYGLIEIENKSKIDFEVDYIKLFKVNGNNRRKASYQKLELIPFLTQGLPKKVKTGKLNKFLFVFPKFTLGDSEKLVVETIEKNGSRELKLLWK
ncbi:DUF4138 domain-containing protein [Maribacter sp. 2210JD10-5]|uniref:DUF4138 domain-containing protein n=1 Tax=Maribacter sp. 2210JD10-5 TaxID=3386272 RepID=UPI0039BD496D